MQQNHRRNKKRKQVKKKGVLCPVCNVNRKWHGGPCPFCVDKPPSNDVIEQRSERTVYPTNPLSYHERNQFVLGLGYKSYGEYLQSDLWHEIRIKVFTRYGRRCWICHRGKKATQIHHLFYSKSNLIGESIGGMRPVCRVCHNAVEMKLTGSNAVKRKPEEVRNESRKLRKSKSWKKKAASIEKSMIHNKRNGKSK